MARQIAQIVEHASRSFEFGRNQFAAAVIGASRTGDKDCGAAPMVVDSNAMKPSKLSVFALPAAAILVLLAGCRDDRRHQASEVTTLEVKTGVVAADAPPADVTRALLTRLAKAQRARVRGLGIPANRDEYLATMAEVRGLAARTSIFETYRARGGAQVPRDLKEDGAVRVVTDGWVSICAHYADKLETATISPLAMTGKNAVVAADLPPEESKLASSPPVRPTRIVVRLAMDSSNSWKVQRIDLDAATTTLLGNTGASQAVPTTAAAQPAIRPAG